MPLGAKRGLFQSILSRGNMKSSLIANCVFEYVSMLVQVELENCMAAAKVTGFGRVLISPTYREGKTYAIQSSGLGSLEPNTLVLGWPTKWQDVGHQDSAEVQFNGYTVRVQTR